MPQIPRVLSFREARPLCVNNRDIVLTSGTIGGIDKCTDDLERMAGKVGDDPSDERRGHLIGQPVAAQKQRRVGLERPTEYVDELRIIRVVMIGANVAIHLIATWMLHRFDFAQFSCVLAFAHGRVVPCQFLDTSGPQFVKPRIADVADDELLARA